MARQTTLVRLLDKLRVAARLSLNPAHNAQNRSSQVTFLQVEQERLWSDFDWPHLRVERRRVGVEGGAFAAQRQLGRPALGAVGHVPQEGGVDEVHLGTGRPPRRRCERATRTRSR